MQTLFLKKYQPVSFDDFEISTKNQGLIPILNILLQLGNLNILLIGNSGVGKTTYIHALLREYYGNIPFQTNILHINSLKEQGIQYHRTDVKTFCQTPSAIRGKKKILILDDLDTINDQIQQIFRNYIDNYSHNVHFISSCSNCQKVVESIQSRLTILHIQPLCKPNMRNIMNNIIANESLSIDEDAKTFILQICGHNTKLLINYLEKCKLLNQTIDHSVASHICTNIPFQVFNEYILHLQQQNLVGAVQLLMDIHDRGYSVMDILDSFFLFVKSTEILNEIQKYTIIPIISKYIAIFHNIHEDEMELALFTNNVSSIIIKKE